MVAGTSDCNRRFSASSPFELACEPTTRYMPMSRPVPERTELHRLTSVSAELHPALDPPHKRLNCKSNPTQNSAELAPTWEKPTHIGRLKPKLVEATHR